MLSGQLSSDLEPSLTCMSNTRLGRDRHVPNLSTWLQYCFGEPRGVLIPLLLLAKVGIQSYTPVKGPPICEFSHVEEKSAVGFDGLNLRYDLRYLEMQFFCEL